MPQDKRIARFGFEESKFYSDGRPKWRFFIPMQKEGVRMLSIANIHDLNRECVENIGIEIGKDRGANKLVGWAAFVESDVAKESLEISYENGPEWHGDIIGWPEQKTERVRLQKNLAKSVADNQGGVLLPENDRPLCK